MDAFQTIQDVSFQLTKPAKDLADWSFPLAEVLEKYTNLLRVPQDINFGEAALVLQNSANVYVRRVEYLLRDTSCLNKTFIEHQIQDEINKTAAKDKKSSGKKSVIDFNDFEPLDLEKDIGKNIEIKNHSTQNKPVKLLSRRFTQLECNTSQLRSRIEILNAHGEVIGKKYDFRCNQCLTTSGMLVDELTPSDFALDNASGKRITSKNDSTPQANTSAEMFARICGSICNDVNCESDKGNRTPLSVSNSVCNYSAEHFTSPLQQDSGYSSMRASSEFSHGSPSHSEQFEETDQNPEGLLLNNYDPPENEESCPPLSELTRSVEEESHISPVHNTEETPGVSTEPSTALASSSSKNDTRRNEQDQCVETVRCSKSNSKNSEQLCSSDALESSASSKDRDPPEADAGYTSGDPEELSSQPEMRRSKRTQNSISTVNDINTKIWEPIPFEQGIPDKIAKRRSHFKLPCHISLLKSKPESRKRKHSSVPKKQESIAKLLSNEFESPRKKMTMYSPTRQLFPLKKEDLDEFQKTFDECFKSMQKSDICNYEAVTSITMDLLGFQPNFTKKDPLVDSIAYAIDAPLIDSANVIASEWRLSPGPNAFTPPNSPDPCDSGDTIAQDPPPSTTSNYEELVERRMREIITECDVQTELEQRVTKWHEAIKTKLSEAESRPAFHVPHYSTRIIDNLRSASNRTMTFGDMVSEEHPAEVARYFFATLQLANSYTININSSEDADRGLELIQLNSERHQNISESFQTLSNMPNNNLSKTNSSDNVRERMIRPPLSEVSNDMFNGQPSFTAHCSGQKKRNNR